ncbi:MAG: TlyA family RNA methyltransferase [Acidobacteriota bacterium]
MKNKTRLDIELVQRKIFGSAEEAAPYIMAGEVLVNGQVIYKRDHKTGRDDVISIKKKNEYVSRGAYKLGSAVKKFNIAVKGKKVVDIGISNGGFSDLLLQMDADSVLGIDVNINQVDYKLRKDDRVTLLKKNARYLTESDIDFEPGLFTIDVSFISVIKILEPLVKFGTVDIIALIKPQFEVEKGGSEKGGIIRSSEKRRDILLSVKKRAEETGYAVIGFTTAGIQGRKGNQEYFFYLKYGQNNSIDDKIIENGI